MPHDVFISYANQDKITADAICGSLEARGIRCWIAPRDIRPGQHWGGAIMTAIKSVRVMVLVFTDSSNRSQQVLREVERAVGHGVVIIPFKIENVPMSDDLEYYISTHHWLDAMTPPLEEHIRHLGDVVKVILAESGQTYNDGSLTKTNTIMEAPGAHKSLVVEVVTASSAFHDPAPGATKVNPIDGAEMIWIPPGPFLMGDDDRPDNPRRTAVLSGYWIYKNLVTVGKYKQYCEATKIAMPRAPDFNAGWAKEDHPIVNVSWHDATAYCKWATAALPTEAQWEKAARGTDGWAYPWGNDWDANKAWCSKKDWGDAGGTSPVGIYGISPYGCSDMAANVWQWCSDRYDEDYMKSAPGKDPVGPDSGTSRVVRGGSWDFDDAGIFRASYRLNSFPGLRRVNVGFRCAAGQ